MAQIEYEVVGFDSALIRVRATGEKLKLKLKEAARESAERGETIMRALAPERSGRLKSTIKTSEVLYRPGAPGGGGYYEVSLSVGEGIYYLQLVVEGSGGFGPGGTPGLDRIFARPDDPAPPWKEGWPPRKGAKVMHFFSNGQEYFRRSVAGQQPQREWIALALAEAQIHLAKRIQEIDIQE